MKLETPQARKKRETPKHPAGTILDASEKPVGKVAEEPKIIVDASERPYSEHNPAPGPRAKKIEHISPAKVERIEKKERKEAGVDSAKIKELEKKIRTLNEQYLSAVQREDKALLYSQLEAAQKEYQSLQEEFEKNEKKSANKTEREKKMDRLNALREAIRDLNERYLREPQREQKFILYSQLEALQKEYRKLEEELDGTSTDASATEKKTTILEEPKVELGLAGPWSGENPEGDKATKINIWTIDDIKPSRPEQTLPLDDLRDMYLNAKRKRGNVVRGMFGRLFGRTLNFGGNNQPGSVLFAGEKMDFGGRNGALQLERVRQEYQEGLLRYRSAQLQALQANLQNRIFAGQITSAMASAEMQTRMVGLLEEEQGNIDNRAVQGIERNVFEKMKTKWRQFTKTRLGVGAGLFGLGALTGGTAIGAGIVGTRAVMGGVGTYVGVESALERYSRLIGHKNGLVRRISNEGRNFVTTDARDRYMAAISPEEIRAEAARLRMLQVEKGVSINNLKTLGDDGAIAAMIIRRDNELTAQEALNNTRLENPMLGIAGMISARLAREENVRNIAIESEVDKERLKKMARKTTAILAGGSVGWLIGGSLLSKPDVVLPNVPHPPGFPPTPDVGPLPVPPDALHTVSSGENLWKIIEATPSVDHTMTGLVPEAKTHFVDALKDIYERMTPSELISRGFHSGIVDNLSPGEVLNLREVVDPGILAHALSNAQGLSPGDISSIMHNNSTIATWLADPTNRSTLTGAFNSKVIDEVLQGLR